MKPRYSTSDPYAEGIVPPNALDAERAILGALLLEPDQCSDVVTKLKPEAYYAPKNEFIYRAIAALYDKGEKIDLYTVGRQLEKEGRMGADQITPAYLAELTQSVGSASHTADHVRIVMEKYIARRILSAGRELAARAADPGTDIADVMDYAAKEIDAITETVTGGHAGQHIREGITAALQQAEKRAAAAQRGEVTGITTGLHELDRITAGWHGSQLIILAARPAMGKTALMLHFAKAAARSGTPVCIYSLEMSNVSLSNRLLLSEAEVESDAFRSGRLTPEDWRKLEPAAATVSRLPIYVDDNPVVSMRYVKNHSRIMAKRGACGMILVDYLQLADMGGDKSRNREQEVAQASRQAKIIAKELNVPVILLSQLSRNVEGRADKKPILADLRESGAIEQDADLVAFIYRPAYYGISEMATRSQGTIRTEGLGILSVAKQRNGACGDIPFRHNAAMTRIGDWDAPQSMNLNTNEPF